MAAALMLASSCTEVKQEGQGYEPIIGKQEITIKDGRLTPEALWAMGRIGSLSISPDGKQIAYTVAYYSVPENKSHHVIYVMDADGKNNTLLTQTAWNESEPQWIKGGTKIAFLCNESGGSQIWEMNPDGTTPYHFRFQRKHRRILFFTGWQKDSFHLTNKIRPTHCRPLP